MKLTGRLTGVSVDLATGEPVLTLTAKNKATVLAIWGELKDKDIDVEIKRHREKRSLDANAYCWTLCEKLAVALSSDGGELYTKEDIYRKEIKRVGVFKDFQNLSLSDAATLRTAWGMLGTGWISEQVDFMPDGENVTVRCYYGSSQYSTAQMSRLIDAIVQDCRAVGIETLTPEEINNMMSLYEQADRR